MKRPQGWKKGAALTAEALASLFMVLASFGLFMAILYYLFPSGTPLREFMEQGAPPPRLAPEERRPEATLAALVRDVRCRRGNSVAWGGAEQGMALYTQDAVQTFDHSQARILFGARDQLMLGSNSLVVVNRGSESEDQGGRTVRVAVSGDVRGKISGGVALELSAGGQVARIAGKGADFRLTHKTSRSATLSVFAGEAEVVGKGKGVRVGANRAVTFLPGGKVAVFNLPQPPVPTAPQRSVYRFRELPPRLSFSWTGGSAEYHFQLARDERFQQLVQDLRLEAPEYQTGVLEHGVYYWRVSRLEQGAEGPFSKGARVELQQRLGQPTLRVVFPDQQMERESCTVRGSTDPGSRVFVNGVEAASAGDGGFSAPVQLKRGVNLIRVEALDEAGNAAYASRVVYGKF